MFADAGRWWLGNLGDAPAIGVSVSVVLAGGARVVQIEDFTLASLAQFEQRSTEPTSLESTAVTILLTWREGSSEEVRSREFTVAANGHR